jgi:hypothetical protein
MQIVGQFQNNERRPKWLRNEEEIWKVLSNSDQMADGVLKCLWTVNVSVSAPRHARSARSG